MDIPDKKTEHKNITKWRLVNLAAEMGFIIALPLLAFAFLGKWIDAKLGSDPRITLLAIVLAIAASTSWLIRRFKELIK